MHLPELIIQCRAKLSNAEHHYAAGDKGLAANILANISNLIQGSVTAGTKCVSYMEFLPKESIQRHEHLPAQNKTSKQSSEAEETSRMTVDSAVDKPAESTEHLQDAKILSE